MAAAATATATLSLSFSLDPQHHFSSFTHFRPRQTLLFNSPTPLLKYLLPLFSKSRRYIFKFSSSSSSSSSSSPSTTTTAPEPVSASSYLKDPLRTGRFLSNEELEELKSLEVFSYSMELESGFLWVRVMKSEAMDMSIALLAESFAESMLLPSSYNSLLRFFIKQYLMERRALMPHAVTLVGFFREREEDSAEEEEEGEEQLAGTVEVSFDKRGANASPPTPTPPKNSPYICNMLCSSSSGGEELVGNFLRHLKS